MNYFTFRQARCKELLCRLAPLTGALRRVANPICLHKAPLSFSGVAAAIWSRFFEMMG